MAYSQYEHSSIFEFWSDLGCGMRAPSLWQRLLEGRSNAHQLLPHQMWPPNGPSPSLPMWSRVCPPAQSSGSSRSSRLCCCNACVCPSLLSPSLAGDAVGFALSETACLLATVLGEAGATVATNVLLRDLHFVLLRQDERCIEVIANGLPLWIAPFASDAMLVGNGLGKRCANQFGGRWSSAPFLCAQMRPLAPHVLRASATAAYVRRWALAAPLVCLPCITAMPPMSLARRATSTSCSASQ